MVLWPRSSSNALSELLLVRSNVAEVVEADGTQPNILLTLLLKW